MQTECRECGEPNTLSEAAWEAARELHGHVLCWFCAGKLVRYEDEEVPDAE